MVANSPYACRKATAANTNIAGTKMLLQAAGRGSLFNAAMKNKIAQMLDGTTIKWWASMASICLISANVLMHPAAMIAIHDEILGSYPVSFYNYAVPKASARIMATDREVSGIADILQIQHEGLLALLASWYDVTGPDLKSVVTNIPAYRDIVAPDTIHNQRLLGKEDIPLLVVVSQIAKLLNFAVPAMDATINEACNTLGMNFRTGPLAVAALGIPEGATAQQIKAAFD